LKQDSYAKKMRMEDASLAVITGGKGGLAQAVAGALGDEMEVRAPGRDELDVQAGASVLDYFSQIASLDLLICNAGLIDDRILAKMPEASWDNVVDTNLKGAFLTARAAAKLMMKKRPVAGGHIIFISSYAAFHPSFGQSSYAAAKSALAGLAKSLAQELGSRNIRVNVIVPGFMETKMTAELPENITSAVRQKHTLGRFNTPEAVGKFIRCLHLEMPATSGQVFNLDSRIL